MNTATQGAQQAGQSAQNAKPEVQQPAAQNQTGKRLTIIDLREPLNIDGETVSRLEMRRATAGDMLRAQEDATSDMGREMHLLGRLVNKNPEDLEKLDLADYRKLQDAFSGFLSE